MGRLILTCVLLRRRVPGLSPGEDHRGQLAARVDLCTIMAKERGGLKAKEAWGGES